MRGRRIALLAMVATMMGCAQQQAGAPPPVVGEQGGSGAMLAYEHTLSIELEQEQVPTRIAALRKACTASAFGACNVLSIVQARHGGALTLRIVPGGVERMTALAGQGGRIASRRTQAEDIGKAVQETQRDRVQLEDYARRLDALAARKDLAVADLIALSREQAGLAEKRRMLEATAATQQMRLDTNLVAFDFADPRHDGRGALGDLGEDMVAGLKEGIGEALPGLAYCLPFLILAFPLALLWWALWRRMTRRGQRKP